MELTYTKVGDYYIPDLALDDDTEYEIGVYGRMREKFLKEHHPGVYNRMVLFGELWKHLAEIDAACHERIDFLISVMAKQEGVTESSKASNQMEWVGYTTFIQPFNAITTTKPPTSNRIQPVARAILRP